MLIINLIGSLLPVVLLLTAKQVADALSLVVERCPDAIYPAQDLCNLLQTSTAIRAALQRSRGSFLIDMDIER